MQTYSLGDDFYGWTIMGWKFLSTMTEDGPTHVIFFRKVCPTIDDADEIAVTNGQLRTGALFCLRNGKIALLPHEFSGIATQR